MLCNIFFKVKLKSGNRNKKKIVNENSKINRAEKRHKRTAN